MSPWSSEASSDAGLGMEVDPSPGGERLCRQSRRSCMQGRLGLGARPPSTRTLCSAPAPTLPPSPAFSLSPLPPENHCWASLDHLSYTPECLPLLTGQTGGPPAGRDGLSLPQGSSHGCPWLGESLLFSLRGRDTYFLPELCRILLKYFLASRHVLRLSTRRQAVGLGPS